jgi:hypothetical protein
VPDEVAVIEALRRLRAHEPATDDQYIRRDDVDPAWRWPFPLKLALESGERPHLLLHLLRAPHSGQQPSAQPRM